jgi:hypothetical protein
MAKALLGHRVFRDERLVLEAARLRNRVRDLEDLVEHLQHDNARLRADVVADVVADVSLIVEQVAEPVG